MSTGKLPFSWQRAFTDLSLTKSNTEAHPQKSNNNHYNQCLSHVSLQTQREGLLLNFTASVKANKSDDDSLHLHRKSELEMVSLSTMFAHTGKWNELSKIKVSVCTLQPQHLVWTAIAADGCFQTQQYATLSTTAAPCLAK